MRALGLFFFLCVAPRVAVAQLTVDVVYPRSERPVSAADSTFVFGSVSDARARVFVNDVPMKLYPNGAFLGVVPVRAGADTLRARAVLDSLTARQEVPIQVSPFLGTTPRDTFALDSSFVFPSEDMELTAGDYLEVAFKGTPGLVASCTIPGLAEDGPMNETAAWRQFYWGEAVFGDGRPTVTPPVAGIYTGVFRIPHGVELDSAAIVFQLRGVDGLSLEMQAPGRLTVRSERVPRIAELTEELTVARTGPGLGYQQFLPAGVRLHITGKRGAYLRARLTDAESVWVPADAVTFQPPGTPLPTSRVQLVRTEELARAARVRIYLQQRLPFKVEQRERPAALVVSVYGATADTDWIRFDFRNPTIRDARWAQPQDGVYQLTIELNHAQQWGFDPYYDGTTLVLDIKKPPRQYKLDHLLICLDPGHGPDDGAIGPTRLKEKDANYQLALTVKQKLEKKGATVFLTRKEAFGASLRVRPKLAAFLGADLLLSLHHNALPDGLDPFRNRGSSTYYYHVQSRPLAAAIQRRLLEKLKLNNFGLYYDNLALCRPPQMPAVLIEPAFIMHPEEEQLIRTKKYREKVADAIVKGIEDFLKQARAREEK